MFVTLVSFNHHIVAKIECSENKLVIHADDDQVIEYLSKIYNHNMDLVEFARANYRLNQLRADGLTWKLVLANDLENWVV